MSMEEFLQTSSESKSLWYWQDYLYRKRRDLRESLPEKLRAGERRIGGLTIITANDRAAGKSLAAGIFALAISRPGFRRDL